MKHVKNKHWSELQGKQPATKVLGPMDAFVRTTSDIEKQLLLNPNVSNQLLREAIENFILTQTEAFTIVESEAFLTVLKICLKCIRDDVFIPEADAIRNGLIKRVESMKSDMTQIMTRSDSD